jgi:hypothetical protein
VEIKETLKEFHSHLTKFRRHFDHLDKELVKSLHEHESRSSRVHGLIDSKEIINKIAEREIAHKHGRIRNHDNTIDRELEGLRRYVDILEESHKLLHEYLVFIRGMREVLEAFENRITHNNNRQVRMVVAQIDVITHQLSSENSLIREEDMLIHNLTEKISEERSELSHIFAHDNENTIRDKRNPLNLMKEKFSYSDLQLRRIAARVNSHNQLAKDHVGILLSETLTLQNSIETMIKHSSEADKGFKRAA